MHTALGHSSGGRDHSNIARPMQAFCIRGLDTRKPSEEIYSDGKLRDCSFMQYSLVLHIVESILEV